MLLYGETNTTGLSINSYCLKWFHMPEGTDDTYRYHPCRLTKESL